MLWKFIFFKLVSLVQLSKYTLHTLWCRQNIPLLLYLYFLLFFPLHPPLTFRLKITQNTQGEKEREKKIPFQGTTKGEGGTLIWPSIGVQWGGGRRSPPFWNNLSKISQKGLFFINICHPLSLAPLLLSFSVRPGGQVYGGGEAG